MIAFPFAEFTGTSYDLGLQHGQGFRDLVRLQVAETMQGTADSGVTCAAVLEWIRLHHPAVEAIAPIPKPSTSATAPIQEPLHHLPPVGLHPFVVSRPEVSRRPALSLSNGGVSNHTSSTQASQAVPSLPPAVSRSRVFGGPFRTTTLSNQAHLSSLFFLTHSSYVPRALDSPGPQ